jgi:hypothetical protein
VARESSAASAVVDGEDGKRRGVLADEMLGTGDDDSKSLALLLMTFKDRPEQVGPIVRLFCRPALLSPGQC